MLLNMLRFGPSGNDTLFYQQGFKSTVQAPAWVSAMGLNAFEYSFGRGIRMSEATAKAIGEEATKHGVLVSAHAPYYINLAKEWEKSLVYIEKSLNLLKLMGGRNLVVHVGSQGELDRATAIENCKKNLKKVLEKLDGDFRICIETMGRYSAIGNHIEICDICSIDPRVVPTLDFGHMNCLAQGGLSCHPELVEGSRPCRQSLDPSAQLGMTGEIMDYCMQHLPREKMQNVHIHFSAIKFGAKGELGHLDFADAPKIFLPLFEPLAKYIKAKNLTPTIICESSNTMAQDAATLKKAFAKF